MAEARTFIEGFVRDLMGTRGELLGIDAREGKTIVRLVVMRPPSARVEVVIGPAECPAGDERAFLDAAGVRLNTVLNDVERRLANG